MRISPQPGLLRPIDEQLSILSSQTYKVSILRPRRVLLIGTPSPRVSIRGVDDSQRLLRLPPPMTMTS